MRTSEQLNEIGPALAKAQAEFKGVPKSGLNSFDRYKYSNLEDYVRTAQPVLTLHGLSIVTGVEEVVGLPDRTTQKGGTEHAVRVRLSVRVLHTSGQWVEADGWGEGQDRADKAVYKAITGGRKYALASVLGLATTDDPEADETTGTAARHQPKQAPRQPAAASPQEPHALEDDETFRINLGECFDGRNFSAEEARTVEQKVCTKKGAKTIEGLDLANRLAFMEAVAGGKFDKFKGTDNKSTPAAAGK